MRHAELLAALLLQVGPALAAVQPPLGYEFFRVVEGNGISVACHKIHDNELELKH